MKNLIVNKLSKSYDSRTVLDDLSFSWPDVPIVGLIGPNGAGKTTLINIVTGFTVPDKGHISYNGIDLLPLKPHQISKAGIARTFQELRLLRQGTLKDNIFLNAKSSIGENPLSALRRGRAYHDEILQMDKEVSEILDVVGLSGRKGELASSLSYGQQKLLSIGCCLAQKPEMILLDEPVAGINESAINEIADVIRTLASQGKQLLIIEHNIDFISKISDWLIVLDDGRVIDQGNTEKVLGNNAVVQAYLS